MVEGKNLEEYEVSFDDAPYRVVHRNSGFNVTIYDPDGDAMITLFNYHKDWDSAVGLSPSIAKLLICAHGNGVKSGIKIGRELQQRDIREVLGL